MAAILHDSRARLGPVRSLPISFYPGEELVEVWVIRDGQPPAAFIFLSGPQGRTCLTGSSSVIHAKNTGDAGVSLDTDAQVLDYLKFFCATVHGEEGPFRIVEDPNFFNPNETANSIKPLTFAESDLGMGAGHRLLQGLVYYHSALFQSDCKVLVTGRVDMLDNAPLAAELWTRPVTFEEPLWVFHPPSDN